jgi:hypothetical protein
MKALSKSEPYFVPVFETSWYRCCYINAKGLLEYDTIPATNEVAAWRKFWAKHHREPITIVNIL